MKYYVIAGEASGDLLGACLMSALSREDSKAEFRFWGGDRMSEVVGQEPVKHIRDLAIMGFVEVLLNLRTVLGNISFCKHDVLQYRPDVLVGIDYPGFNLKLEAFAHEQGIRTVHYVSPQLWAWKKGRIKGMRRNLDKLCYILPFEQQFYAANNLPQACYVGHPLLDVVGTDAASNNALSSDRPIVALLPGSRKQEIKKVLPTMLRLADKHPEYQFVIAGMSLIGAPFYAGIIGGRTNVSLACDQTYSLLSNAYAALVCSGTATLETALFDVPQVVCYSANAISVAIARRFVGNRIRYISLVNLIADEPIVTELIQQDLSDSRLEEEFNRITSDEGRSNMLEGYRRMRQLLGGAGASQRTAQQIINTAKS